MGPNTDGNCCGNAWTTGLHRCNNCPMTVRPAYQPANTGWICPRCQRVHAPFVVGCGCAGFAMSQNIGAGITGSTSTETK